MPASRTPDPGARPVAEPLDIARGFVDAWNRHDGDGIARLFTADADFVNVVGFHWEGRRAIAKAHRRGFAVMFGSSTQRLTRTSVRMLGGDTAVIHAHWHLTGQVDPHGTPVGDRRGVFTFVATRQEDGWLAVAAHNTDIVPGAETHARRGDRVQAVTYLPGRTVNGRPLPAQE